MFFYRYWKLLAGSLLGMIIIILVIDYTSSRNQPLPPLSSLSELEPGITHLSQLQDLPTLYHQDTDGTTQRVLFGQNRPQGYSEVIATSDVVTSLKKTNPLEFEFPRLDQYVSKYGQTTWYASTPWSEYGFIGYVYPIEGRVIVAHPETQEVVEEWIVEKNIDLAKINQLFPPDIEGDGH